MCCDNVKPGYKPVIGCGVGLLIVVLGALGISIYNTEAIRHLQDEMKNKNQVIYSNSNITDTGLKPVLFSSKTLSEIVPLDTKNVATVSNSLPNSSSNLSSLVNFTELSNLKINGTSNFTNYTSFQVNSTYLSWINSSNNTNWYNISNSSFQISSQINLKPLQRIIKANSTNLINKQSINSTVPTLQNEVDDEFVTVFCNGIRVTDKIKPSSNVEVEYHDDHLIITCNGRQSRIKKTKKPNTVVFKNGEKILTAKPKPTSLTAKPKPTSAKPVSRVTELKPTSAKPTSAKPTSAIRIIAQSSNFKSKQKTLTQTPKPNVFLSYKSKNKIIKMLPALKYLSNYAREKPIINIKLIKNTSSKLDDIFKYEDEDEECNDSFEDCDD